MNTVAKIGRSVAVTLAVLGSSLCSAARPLYPRPIRSGPVHLQKLPRSIPNVRLPVASRGRSRAQAEVERVERQAAQPLQSETQPNSSAAGGRPFSDRGAGRGSTINFLSHGLHSHRADTARPVAIHRLRR